MAKIKTTFFCSHCGYESPKWLGKCPGCHEYNAMVEELKEKKNPDQPFTSISSNIQPQKITELKIDRNIRTKTKYAEFNRVLGGGIVQGSLVLIGGDPGIGKSTLLLQMSASISQQALVLYVSGEESEQQIKSRATRLGITTGDLYVFSENNLNLIIKQIDKMQPDFIVIDSIQTIYLDYILSLIHI